MQSYGPVRGYAVLTVRITIHIINCFNFNPSIYKFTAKIWKKEEKVCY